MKLVLFSLISIIVFSSCCKSEFRGEQKFSIEEKSVNPYSGFEDVRFVDDTGKVIFFTYGRRTVLLKEFPENEGISCSDYFIVEEEDRTTYRCLNPSSILTISIHNNTNPFTNDRNPAILTISYENTTYNPSFYQTYGNISVDTLLNGFESGIFKKNLHLRDKDFENVFVLPGRLYYQNTEDRDTLFYSIREGLLGIKFIDGDLWIKQ